MDEDRDALSDVDRAIAEALDVDVSPEFAVRVRQRIAGERMTMGAPLWRGWRMAMAAAAAAAVIAAGAVATLSTRDHAVPQRLAARPLPVEPLRPVNASPERRVLVADRAAPQNRSRTASVPARAQTEPEVLVPREEIEMYRRLIADAQNVPHALVVEGPRDIVSVGLITEITIDPIKIELIIPSVDGEGDRQ
jgi:endonuclease/exonuclease/phosphatase (EEP) superfamily protein YafD